MFSIWWNKLRSIFGTLTVAEVRSYAWDGVQDLYTRHGWTDMFGDPYTVDCAVGLSTQNSGWVDCRYARYATMQVAVVGSAADSVGFVQVIFEMALSLYDIRLQDERADLVISVDVAGTTQQVAVSALPCTDYGFLRVKSVNNLSNKSVNVRVVATDNLKPIIP